MPTSRKQEFQSKLLYKKIFFESNILNDIRVPNRSYTAKRNCITGFRINCKCKFLIHHFKKNLSTISKLRSREDGAKIICPFKILF